VGLILKYQQVIKILKIQNVCHVGACVQACPTATLIENTIIEAGVPEHSVTTTCAYCGVGCSFHAEMKGEEVVRMTPNNRWWG